MKTKPHLILTIATLAIVLSNADALAQAGRQETAIWIRDNPAITLQTTHPSGVFDPASTARQNIVDTANCQPAKTSGYSDVGVTSVWLHTGMLNCMKALTATYGYSYRVTEIAGGDHSSGSYHYRGTAFDVSVINGAGVSSSNPYWATFNQRCRNMGSIESLGPGDAGHSTHVHNAWPSGTAASAPGGCAPLPPPPIRLDVFVRGTDNALWHKSYDGTAWSVWETLGGILSADPAAVSWGPNRIDVFVRNNSNALEHKWWDGTSWSAYENLGGILAGAPAASSWGVGRLDVFARDLNNTLVHKFYQGGWSVWETLGGILTADPAAVSWGPNRIDVFVRDNVNALEHKFWDGTAWSPYQMLGGYLTAAPAASSWAPGRLDVFVRNVNNELEHKFYAGGWSVYENLGGNLTSAPAAVSPQANRVDVFVKGTDNALWHKWHINGVWSNWESLGGTLVGAPAVASWSK